MASYEFVGLEEFINLCDITEKSASGMIGRSIYSGAKVMADAVRSAVDSLPVEDKRQHSKMRSGLTSYQLEGLKKGLGISRIKKGVVGKSASRQMGTYGWNVKIGFDGYNSKVTKKYPKGQPNAMIARSLNSGTSFLKKYPFMDMTVERNADRTVHAIEEEFDRQLQKLWGR